MKSAPGELDSTAAAKPWGICLSAGMSVVRGLGSLREAAFCSQTAAGGMSLSAAVSACCAVWKSSVMAYLMVIVRGGERLPCLHAGICRGSGVEASAAAVGRQEGDGEISL